MHTFFDRRVLRSRAPLGYGAESNRPTGEPVRPPARTCTQPRPHSSSIPDLRFPVHHSSGCCGSITPHNTCLSSVSDHLNTDSMKPAICGSNADPYLQGRRDLPCVRILPDTSLVCLSVFSLEDNSSNPLSLGNADPYLPTGPQVFPVLGYFPTRHFSAYLGLCPTLPLDAPVNHLQVSSILISRTVRAGYRHAGYASIPVVPPCPRSDHTNHLTPHFQSCCVTLRAPFRAADALHT